ncbi:RNA dependent RNA polymerase-domain-containing protein, partial [Aspergillus germanicus]
MEVFLHNLPVNLTEDGLKQQLLEFMNALGIEDYSCDKPRKKRFGNITFLNIYDGRRFLSTHGETFPQGQKRPVSNLRLLGTPVFCKVNNREPLDYALKALAHNANERHRPTHVVEERGSPITFTMLRCSCGYTTFLNDEFLYVPEVQWETPGIVTFKKRILEVSLENTRLTKIPFNTIFEIVWTSSGSLLVTLMSVPLFFHKNPGEVTLGLDLKAATWASRSRPTRSRVSSLGTVYSEIVGQCLVYNFQVIPFNMQPKIDIPKECGLTIIPDNFNSIYLGDFRDQLTILKSELAQYTRDGSLPFTILFQLQGLAYNAYLPPVKIRVLTRNLASVFKSRKQAGKRQVSVNSVKKLFNLIDWVSPQSDPKDFSVDSLVDAVLGSEQDLHDGIIQVDGLARPSPNLAHIFRILIRVRPSMIKFESKDMANLEICDVASKPIPLVLNRQVIKILEDMGATATTKNTAKFIRGQDVAECIKLYRFLLLINRLQLNYKEDPFLRGVVEAMVLRELRLLKHKARIPVRKGITLFGIMDETGFLEEKEVFVTYDTMGNRFAPPPGYCRLFVTRSPARHDGDIQYVYNRRPPSDHPLTKHKNCIVFSQKGKRDLPSQLSGGDLDGDLYNVIWDPEAVPERVFAPADYPRFDPVDIKREVTKNDMAEFFVDFMQSDRLGVIATKHMILADQMELGTSHSDCKKLVELHSTAVDFSKTGVPVKFEDMPSMNKYRPDLFNSIQFNSNSYLMQPEYGDLAMQAF